MCGAVRYEGHGDPLHIGYCHCRSCRHHSGAAVAGMLVFKQDKVSLTSGHLSIYQSSPGVERGFCGRCGSSLSWTRENLISLHIGSLDNPDAYPPTLHWRFEERCPWYDDANDLPHETMIYPDPD